MEKKKSRRAKGRGGSNKKHQSGFKGKKSQKQAMPLWIVIGIMCLGIAIGSTYTLIWSSYHLKSVLTEAASDHKKDVRFVADISRKLGQAQMFNVLEPEILLARAENQLLRAFICEVLVPRINPKWNLRINWERSALQPGDPVLLYPENVSPVVDSNGYIPLGKESGARKAFLLGKSKDEQVFALDLESRKLLHFWPVKTWGRQRALAYQEKVP